MSSIIENDLYSLDSMSFVPTASQRQKLYQQSLKAIKTN